MLIRDFEKGFDKVWFSSDHLFGHPTIIRERNRPFKSIKEMNSELVKRWNEKIDGGEQVVFYLGDFTWGNEKMFRDHISQLNGTIFILISPWGGDRRWLNPNDVRTPRIGRGRDGVAFLSNSEIPVVFLSPLCVIEIDSEHIHPIAITLCHRPLEEWNRQQYGGLHLYGHTLTKETDKEKRINIGVDYQDYAPIHLSTLINQ